MMAKNGDHVRAGADAPKQAAVYKHDPKLIKHASKRAATGAAPCTAKRLGGWAWLALFVALAGVVTLTLTGANDDRAA